jgi:hypothetical protein
MNTISRTANSTSNTALSVLGGEYTSGATAIEHKRIEFELLKILWRDSEGPDEKVSRHTVCLFTQGRTLYHIAWLTLTISILTTLIPLLVTLIKTCLILLQ